MSEMRTRKLSLAEFMETKEPTSIENILGSLNGGTFMQCHKAIYAETGIWIPELVPVFQKLDAKLVARDLPAGLG